MPPSELAEQIQQYPWYHTIDLGNGLATKGMFDHRGQESHYLIPDNLAGMRCLDVGTMDGYWAYALERRGADEVVAVDLDNPEELDWPMRIKSGIVMTIDETKGTRFELVRTAIGSKVDRRLCSVYKLDPAELGLFDLVFCGDLLCHLKDPVSALEHIRSVCRGSAIICTPIMKERVPSRKPLAMLDGIDGFSWWTPNINGFKRMLSAAGFERMEIGKPFDLPDTAGIWQGHRVTIRAYI